MNDDNNREDVVNDDVKNDNNNTFITVLFVEMVKISIIANVFNTLRYPFQATILIRLRVIAFW